jgi:hypothetical protein
MSEAVGEFYRQQGGAQGRRESMQGLLRAAQRSAWASDPRVHPRRRQIVERRRDQELGV